MNALVIDDSRAMRLILRRMLAQLGFDAAEAANGLEGLSRLGTSERLDLILVDWNMPEMTGIEFVKAVRQPPYSFAGPVVMVTTETGVDEMVTALDAGADEYIMKPFTQESIAEKLQLLGLDL